MSAVTRMLRGLAELTVPSFAVCQFPSSPLSNCECVVAVHCHDLREGRAVNTHLSQSTGKMLLPNQDED